MGFKAFALVLVLAGVAEAGTHIMMDDAARISSMTVGDIYLTEGTSVTMTGTTQSAYFYNPTFGTGKWRFSNFDGGLGMSYLELQPGALIFSNYFAGTGSGSWSIKDSNTRGNFTFSDGTGAGRLFSFDPDGNGTPTFTVKATGTTNLYGLTTSSLTVNGGTVAFYSRTLAQINAFTPGGAGEALSCSNCTSDAICISSGTGTGSFTDPQDKTTHCH